MTLCRPGATLLWLFGFCGTRLTQGLVGSINQPRWQKVEKGEWKDLLVSCLTYKTGILLHWLILQCEHCQNYFWIQLWDIFHRANIDCLTAFWSVLKNNCAAWNTDQTSRGCWERSHRPLSLRLSCQVWPHHLHYVWWLNFRKCILLSTKLTIDLSRLRSSAVWGLENEHYTSAWCSARIWGFPAFSL